MGRRQLARGGNPYSLSFNGSDQFVDLGKPLFPTDGSAWTACAWVKKTVNDPQGAIFSQDESLETGRTLPIYYRNTTDGWTCFNSGSGFVFHGDSNIGEWVFLVTVNDGPTIYAYFNAELKDQANDPHNVIERDTWFGKYRSDYYESDFDRLKIYHRALSQNEITKLYKGVSISRAGLVGEWNMNKGTGDTAYDSSGNGNHGTLVNGPTWSTDTPTYGG